MKKCFKCGVYKQITDFYVHSRMKDGHLNKCIECTKKDTKERNERMLLNPEWKEKERKRGLEKYYRLYCNVENLDLKKELALKLKKTGSYFEKYPEKYKAKNVSQRVKAPDGKEKHHWSYNEEHYKDVIFLSTDEHNLLHRFIIYDPERMMYRNAFSGELYDNKQSHIDLLEKIKDC